MSLTNFCIVIAFAISTGTSAVAGGRGCDYKANGLPLLMQSPVLADILSEKFSVQDKGVKGPSDAPFDGGRLYTYMEFRAATVDDRKEKFLIRIHFERKGKVELIFDRLEILLPERYTGKTRRRSRCWPGRMIKSGVFTGVVLS